MPILKVMNVMGANIGQQTETYANSRNESRIIRSKRRSSSFAKDETMSGEERAVQQDFYEHEKGPLY